MRVSFARILAAAGFTEPCMARTDTCAQAPMPPLSVPTLCVGGMHSTQGFGPGGGVVQDAPTGPRRPGCLAACPASPPSQTQRSARRSWRPDRKRNRRQWSLGLLAGSQAAARVLALALAPAQVPALVAPRVLRPAGTRSGTALPAGAVLLVSEMQALADAHVQVPGNARGTRCCTQNRPKKCVTGVQPGRPHPSGCLPVQTRCYAPMISTLLYCF